MSEREQLEQAIAHLEAQRALLGDATVDAALAGLHQRLAALDQAEGAPALALEGERKLVTVMFADISGFTTMAETMDPEVIRDLVNACFERLVPAIERYGGVVDKFLGDAIMALFGAPAVHENDPERALRAARTMLAALEDFNQDRGTDLGLHIGVNTGTVIAGGIGTREQRDYSVMGDAVNVAKRLENLSQRGEILVGPDTHRLTTPIFRFEALPPVRVKGKSEAVPVFRLLAPRATPGKLRGIAGLESPLVGRQQELAALQAAVAQVLAGQGGVVTLVGEAGLGKSRLVAEVRHDTPAGQAAQMGPLHWIEGRCLSHGSSIAYLLWLDLLRGLLGLTVEVRPALVGRALHERVQDLCPERFPEVYPYIGRMMSLPLEEKTRATLDALGGEELKAGTFRAVEILLRCTAQQQPLIVVCEDLHWADATSIELLEHLLPLTGIVPLLFICVFRPRREHPCGQVREVSVGLHHDRHTDLWLSPLSPEESATLVGNLLRVEDLPDQLRQRILGHAEGNPFYVEEIIRSLIDEGAIVHEEASGRWQATRDIACITIPDTLRGVLMARIDRLQKGTKRVLQLAAVIGRVFLYRVLDAIAATAPAGEERDLDTHLLSLQQEEMIRERARIPELEYIFKHHLTQEAAYEGLLRRERRIFHRRVAEALEQLFADRIGELLGLLAHHWERSEEPERAIDYLLRAGMQAHLDYAHQEAIGYYRRALALLRENRDYEQIARTLMQLGLVYQNARDFSQARQAYQEGFAMWQRAGEIAPAGPLSPAPHALRDAGLEPTTLDPTMVGDVVSGGIAIHLFSGLTLPLQQWQVVPELAQGWEILDDGRRYLLHLREGVYWSDGVPITAPDLVYAWRRLLDPATAAPLAYALYDVKGARALQQGEVSDPQSLGVRALDDLTVEVELEGPRAYFLHLLTLCPTYPLPRHAIDKYGQAWTEPENLVTSGPFRIASWTRGESLVLARNPAYHGRFTGNLQRVEILLSRDPLDLLALYQDDQLDLLNIRSLPPQEMERARQRHAGEYISSASPTVFFLEFDTRRPPFNDARVRRALTLATDRETLAGVVRRGYRTPATGGFIPPAMSGHCPGVALPYDPRRARQLLAEAGYPQGQGLPAISVRIGSPHAAEGEFLQEQWKELLGVETCWDMSRSTAPLSEVDHHIVLSGWVADYPDPDAMLRASPFRENTGWQHETYTRLVEEASKVLDHSERMTLYQQAEQILVEEAPILPLYYMRWHLLVKPWVKRVPGLYKDVIVEPHESGGE